MSKTKELLTELYCLTYKFKYSLQLFDYIKSGQDTIPSIL